MTKAVVALLLAIALAGCVTDPKVFAVEDTREIARSKDVVWQRLTQFYIDAGFRVTALEKESGVVSGERETHGAPTAWWHRGMAEDIADCGKDFWAAPEGQVIRLNAHVSSLDANRSRATVKVFVVENHLELAGMETTPPPTTCNSTGALEARVLNEIGK